jgi:hypothetical protein
MVTPNRNATLARDSNIVAGIGKRLQSVQTVMLDGTAYAPSELTDLYESQISGTANIAALRAQLKDALLAEQVLAKRLDALTKALKGYVSNAFGATSTALGDFGFAPAKVPGPKDPVTKVVAAAKGLATRKARGTKGKRQRERIVGEIPATVSIVLTSSGKPATPSE